jgi:hypothetical protein
VQSNRRRRSKLSSCLFSACSEAAALSISARTRINVVQQSLSPENGPAGA